MPKYKFLPGQEEFILANYLKMPANEIGSMFGINGAIIIRFLKKRRLSMPKEIRYKLQSAKKKGITTFTAEQDEFIVANYLTMPIKSIGDKIGRSYTGIMLRLERMGLELPSEVIERNKQSARIKPGNVPVNKGKKQTEYMDAETIARTAATRFKKGNLSANTKEADGAISIRFDHANRNGKPYKYIRVSLGKWRLLQHVNWEQVNGPIPKGYMLRCRTEDTLNCDINNWELITMAENAVRNSGAINLNDKYVATKLASRSRKIDQELKKELLEHPELLEIKRQELLLSRAIKQHGRK